ncbi:MAG: hypothetical protein JO303_15910 [Caulobacteraceae bacterium]|nr:hypothetical protein [Caulobacteraceae bacterium]
MSGEDQNLGRQRAALDAAGCAQITEEVQSGVKARRRLDQLLGGVGPARPQHRRGDRHDGRADPAERGAEDPRPALPRHRHQ